MSHLVWWKCFWANFAIYNLKTFTNILGPKGCNPHGWYTTTWTYVPPGLEEMCKELFVAEQILQSTPFVEHLVCNLTCALAHHVHFVHTCHSLDFARKFWLFDIILMVSQYYWNRRVLLKVIVVRDQFLKFDINMHGLTLLNSQRCSGCGRVDKYSVVGDGM